MQYCEMFSVLVLGYTVCFKITGPRKYSLVSTENTCLFTLTCGRPFRDISHDKCWKLLFGASKFENCLGEDTPDPPYKARASGIRHNTPRYKKPSYSPVNSQVGFYPVKTSRSLLNIASGIYIYFTNISEGTAFLFQGLTYKEEVRLRPCLHGVGDPGLVG